MRICKNCLGFLMKHLHKSFLSIELTPRKKQSKSDFGIYRISFNKDHNLTVLKLKCIWNKYANYEKMKVTSSFGILKTKYHNGSYLLLFGKGKFLQSFEISCV